VSNHPVRRARARARDARLVNPLKAGLAGLAIICVTVLLALERIPSEAGFGLLGTLVGIALGNGIAVIEGVPVEPIIGTNRRDRRAGDEPVCPECGGDHDLERCPELN